MACPTGDDRSTPSSASLFTRLGLNRSTLALLSAILLIGMGQELWSPFMPKYIQQTLEQSLHGRLQLWGLSQQAVIVLAVGLFGTWKDLQEAICYYIGGRIGGTLGTRRALICFAMLPLLGYAMLLLAPVPLATLAAFAAVPFIGAYDSISQPATLTVVGQTLSAGHRTMALSLQSIQRRIPRIISYVGGGILVARLGAVGGVHVGLLVSAALVLLAVVVQIRMLKSDTRDSAARLPGFSLGLLRRFDPELRKLLIADIFARVSEGLPRELFILYAVTSQLHAPGFGTFDIGADRFGQFLAGSAFVSMLTYLPIGWIASRPGARKKPFILLTFIFFATFPLAFWLLGSIWGTWGLVAAYTIAGLREIGEPARKAMITELLPPDAKTAATGLYWSMRTASVMLCPLIGAVLWLTISPAAVFIIAFGVGILGAVFFAILFGRGGQMTSGQ